MRLLAQRPEGPCRVWLLRGGRVEVSNANIILKDGISSANTEGGPWWKTDNTGKALEQAEDILCDLHASVGLRPGRLR